MRYTGQTLSGPGRACSLGVDGAGQPPDLQKDCESRTSMRLWELEAMGPGAGKGLSRNFCSTGREGLGVQLRGGT